LLVLGDGTACRSPKAPGYFDHRSAVFDAAVERAVRTGDLGAVMRIDPDLARELMATGRAAWQVLAGAMNGSRLATEIRYYDDPFGVAYLVASLRVGSPPPNWVPNLVHEVN
jgi:aromatic ring-opening dioxygenase LigB subunit